jgi:hypothetical protein
MPEENSSLVNPSKSQDQSQSQGQSQSQSQGQIQAQSQSQGQIQAQSQSQSQSQGQIQAQSQSQIFKTIPPPHILLDFLTANFNVEGKNTQFLISKFLFKKTEYNAYIQPFINALKPHYYGSRRKYVERELNYNYFLTIIRQLCKLYKINYETKLVYDKSSYEIEYSIFKS